MYSTVIVLVLYERGILFICMGEEHSLRIYESSAGENIQNQENGMAYIMRKLYFYLANNIIRLIK